ncbi:MAG TPA: hypothetical protein PKE26_13075 [Kiritimatiellia bacterium]|nr:hypothetical protein [Kiritimatiellia bacterium]HMP00035.1 hypothetical protein [Kiritimatiellia bacterium]HMP97520.1 hypothetical protein [Kiritimatiellia bacterium]
MNTHLYLMCYQGEALVASHLNAEQFGAYMAVGTQKHTSGNLLFFELNPEFSSDFLRWPAAKVDCAPHADGSPRRSKYLSIYRVLEHVPLSAFGKLHLVTRDGRVLSLDAANYTESETSASVHLYTELAPVCPRVVSSLSPAAFARFITDPANPVSVPRVFFSDSLIEREADGSLAGYLPYPNPAHIVDCMNDVEGGKTKKTKTVERNPQLVAFYRTIGRGFFLGDAGGIKFYPFPTRDELDDRHHVWWRSASLD